MFSKKSIDVLYQPAPDTQFMLSDEQIKEALKSKEEKQPKWIQFVNECLEKKPERKKKKRIGLDTITLQRIDGQRKGRKRYADLNSVLIKLSVSFSIPKDDAWRLLRQYEFLDIIEINKKKGIRILLKNWKSGIADDIVRNYLSRTESI